jgi:phenylpropionate dioxygenase-like ring-hydroxylating dioxygenase large terminal subunit
MNADLIAPPPGAIRSARALEARHYVGATAHETDRRAVFSRSWQLVAHREQLAEAGDHVVENLAGTPVIVLRGRDGTLRAFPNVCRHRAGPLAHCSGKGMHNLRCKYHGWLYDHEGRLIGAPEMQGADEFDMGDIRLPPLRVQEWQGLVFVALHDEVPDFDAVYAGIAERIKPVDLGAMRFTRRDIFDVACNWKAYVDNFLEGYHLPLVHPGLSRLLDYRAYETETFEWHSLQHSPLRNADAVYGDGEALYFFVYPNVMLNVMPGRMQTNRVLPLGPGRCRVEFDYYYLQDPGAMARIDEDRAFSDAVQHEDVAICEAVQRGLESGFYEAGRLSPRRERGVWHFHQKLRDAYARDDGSRGGPARSGCAPGASA